MTLTPEQRDGLRALAEKATPGPWRADECLPASPGQFAVVTPREENAPYADQPAQYVTPWGLTGTDAALIAAMRNALPAILDALDAAEAAVQRVRDLHTPRVEEAITGACADEECDHDGPCPGSPFTVCAECWRIAEETYRYFGEDGIAPVLYPCPTRLTLDGDA